LSRERHSKAKSGFPSSEFPTSGLAAPIFSLAGPIFISTGYHPSSRLRRSWGLNPCGNARPSFFCPSFSILRKPADSYNSHSLYQRAASGCANDPRPVQLAGSTYQATYNRMKLLSANLYAQARMDQMRTRIAGVQLSLSCEPTHFARIYPVTEGAGKCSSRIASRKPEP
jgi:hypothetical protein